MALHAAQSKLSCLGMDDNRLAFAFPGQGRRISPYSQQIDVTRARFHGRNRGSNPLGDADKTINRGLCALMPKVSNKRSREMGPRTAVSSGLGRSRPFEGGQGGT
jgi:hypothetical protein